MRVLGVVVFLLCLVRISYSQDCIGALKKAKVAYEGGNIHEVEHILEGCIENGFDKTQKLEAYKLLVLVNLFDDQYEKADQYMTSFLKLDPEYEIKPNEDPKEFVRLYNQFKTLPILSVGVLAGVNNTSIQVMEQYGVNDQVTNPGAYSSGFGYQFGLKFNRYITKKLAVDVDFMLSGKSYVYTNTQFGFAESKMTESQMYIETPITFSYEFGNHKLRPYIGIGASAGYLISAKMDPSRIYSTNTLPEVGGNDIDLIENGNNLRQRFTYWLVAEIGLKYKVKRGFLSVDVLYKRGMLNQVSTENRYSNQDLVFQYYHVDDDFSIDNIAISLGYAYSLYNPKKKKIKQ